MTPAPLPGKLLVVTDRRRASAPLERVIAAAIEDGARWIWLRDRDMDRADRVALGRMLARLCSDGGARLSVGGSAQEAMEIGADAVHLPGAGDPARARALMGPGALVGISAHSLSEAQRAIDAGADYATLSPIFATASKPGYGPALGLSAIAQASARALPVVALGGIDGARAAACLEAGAAAVAALGAVMENGRLPQDLRALCGRS